MNTFKSTSKGRPSHATLARRAAFDRQVEHAQLVADIPHLWSVVANVARLQLHAARLNARAAHLERTGAEDASEESLFAQQRESEDFI